MSITKFKIFRKFINNSHSPPSKYGDREPKIQRLWLISNVPFAKRKFFINSKYLKIIEQC